MLLLSGTKGATLFQFFFSCCSKSIKRVWVFSSRVNLIMIVDQCHKLSPSFCSSSEDTWAHASWQTAWNTRRWRKSRKEQEGDGGSIHQVHDVTANHWPVSSPGHWTCWTWRKEAGTEESSGHMWSGTATQSETGGQIVFLHKGKWGGGKEGGRPTGTPTVDIQVRGHLSWNHKQ